MNPMNKKALILSVLIILLFVIFGCWLLFRAQKQISETINPLPPVQLAVPEKFIQPKSSLPEGFVWYEIPELEIKFAVTPDTKKDLKYTFGEYKLGDIVNKRYVIFFSSSQTNERFEGCTVSEAGMTCGQVNVDVWSNSDSEKYKDVYNEYPCAASNGKKIYGDERDMICIWQSRTLTDEEYRNFFGINNSFPDKKYGVSFDSLLFRK